MKKLKVLNVYNELRFSGAEIRILNGDEIWKKEGIVNHVLSTGETEIGGFSKEFEKLNFKVFHIPFKKSIFFFLDFYKLIKKEEYDIIHVFAERANLYYIIVSWFAGKKIVRSICNYFKFDKSINAKKKIERKIIRALKCQQVSISKSIFENENETFSNKTKVIENWINEKKFIHRKSSEYFQLRKELEISEDKFILITVANCNNVKNHSLIIQSLPYLKTQIPNILYLHIGEEEHDEERKLAAKLGVNNEILFLGRQSLVRKYLAVSDVYLMPSFYEGFGNASVEALAVGIPAILTNVAGSKDFKNLPGVFMMESIDEESLTKSILKIHTMSTEERSKMGAKASLVAIKKYNTERGIMEFVHLYRKLCK